MTSMTIAQESAKKGTDVGATVSARENCKLELQSSDENESLSSCQFDAWNSAVLLAYDDELPPLATSLSKCDRSRIDTSRSPHHRRRYCCICCGRPLRWKAQNPANDETIDESVGGWPCPFCVRGGLEVRRSPPPPATTGWTGLRTRSSVLAADEATKSSSASPRASSLQREPSRLFNNIRTPLLPLRLNDPTATSTASRQYVFVHYRDPADGGSTSDYARRYRQMHTVNNVGRASEGERTLSDLDPELDPYLRKFRSYGDFWTRLRQMMEIDEQLISSTSDKHQKESPAVMHRSHSAQKPTSCSPDVIAFETRPITRPATGSLTPRPRTADLRSQKPTAPGPTGDGDVDDARLLFDAILTAIQAARTSKDLSKVNGVVLGQRGLQLLPDKQQPQRDVGGASTLTLRPPLTKQPTFFAEGPREGVAFRLTLHDPAATNAPPTNRGDVVNRSGQQLCLARRVQSSVPLSREAIRRSRGQQSPLTVVAGGLGIPTNDYRDCQMERVGAGGGGASACLSSNLMQRRGLSTMYRHNHVVGAAAVAAAPPVIVGPTPMQLVAVKPSVDLSLLIKLA